MVYDKDQMIKDLQNKVDKLNIRTVDNHQVEPEEDSNLEEKNQKNNQKRRKRH